MPLSCEEQDRAGFCRKRVHVSGGHSPGGGRPSSAGLPHCSLTLLQMAEPWSIFSAPSSQVCSCVWSQVESAQNFTPSSDFHVGISTVSTLGWG